ncbi:unnamed protein product [Adineta steineri]|uniref:Uncharacterized protein n=2 Tax=Adineta steineri TaxID=433720 RepID=A0A814UYJ6_9BILA|nr:unnamed protein product [Adineta steineri]
MKSSTYIYSPENDSSQQQSTAAQHNKLSEEKFILKHRFLSEIESLGSKALSGNSTGSTTGQQSGAGGLLSEVESLAQSSSGSGNTSGSGLLSEVESLAQSSSSSGNTSSGGFLGEIESAAKTGIEGIVTKEAGSFL